MDLLDRIEQELGAARSAGDLDRAFVSWRLRQPALRRFGGVEELIEACRDDAEESREPADVALGTLCQEASSGDETASVLLIWLLLPGLLKARARLSAPTTMSVEDLTAELLAGLWEQAAAISPPARRVAAQLVNAARWRALAAVRGAADWQGRTTLLPEDGGPAHGPHSDIPGPDPDGLSVAVREGVLSEEEMELVLAGRDRIREISERLGIRIHAAQVRRDRARSRLREWAARTYESATSA